MIGGLSGVRADVIPFGMAHGPLARLVGLNVVGMRRRGVRARPISMRCARRLSGAVRRRRRVPRAGRARRAEYADDPLVGKIVDFIRAGKAAA